MVYDARQIANWFVQRANRDGKQLSIMSLLKLTYIAHGWFLEMRGQPLFDNEIEAWQYGPVIPEVYHSFRRKGVVVSEMLEGQQVPEELSGFLEQIYSGYAGLSPFQLSDMTHQEGGPWDRARKREGWYAAISNADILDHYRGLRQQYLKGAVAG